MTLREAIDRGHAARRAGRLEEALTLYGRALELAPSDAEANSLYGLVSLHLGRIDSAEAGLRKAVRLDPPHIAYRVNLTEFLERQGLIGEAIAVMRTVAAQAPGFSRGCERLGDLLAQANRMSEAMTYLQRASALEPNNPTLAIKCAAAACVLGRLTDARQILERAARLSPDNPAVFQLQAEVAEAQGDWPSLERFANAWLRLQPRDAGPWRALATAFYETGRLREAMELYRKVMEYSVRDAAHLTVYAQYCLNVSEFDAAEAALTEAEKLDPQYVEMLSAKALLLTYLGRFGEAESYCRHSLAVDPKHVPGYRILNQLKRGRLSDDERDALSRLSQDQGLRTGHRISASFALADSLDARGEFAEAFAAYESANRIGFERARKENIGYDAAKRTAWIDRLIALFSSPAPRVQDELGPRPIFIVGMPRSGTTLTESVLAAHSRVFGCGERTVMPQILVDFLLEAKKAGPSQISAQRWRDWVKAYWYDLPDVGGADHVTDKNPFNFEAVGLIVQLFPSAKIVHLRRNPIETGLSIFRNEMPKFVSFANRLEDIGHYYGQYARLVAHWERALPDGFQTIQYEDFVADFDRAAPALLATCGLNWEEACGEHDKHSRPIATFSAVQVRDAVRPQEERARQYEPYLKPLVDTLDAAGVDMTTGALRL